MRRFLIAHKSTTERTGLLTSLLCVIHSVLCCRIILNLRGTARVLDIAAPSALNMFADRTPRRIEFAARGDVEGAQDSLDLQSAVSLRHTSRMHQSNNVA